MANETILVVDGDTRSRKILEVSFKKSGYRVLMTDTIAGAVDYLEEETPDLIVSDTQLPDGDGFEFCKRIKENPSWEYTPFLFLTDESSLPRKIKGIEIGADDYLTRPIYIKEVTTRVEVLLKKRDRELLSEGEVEEFRGELTDITLIDLLQTIDEESRSGVVEFWRDDANGSITFRNGEVVDASCGKLRGPEAVYRLMLWPGGRFWVRYHEDVPEADYIEMSTEDLLLEGIRRIERWDEIVADLPAMDRVFEPDYEKLPGFLDAVPDEVGRVVRLFDGYRTIREVVDDSPVGDVTAAEIIQRVFREGILEEVEGPADREDAAASSQSHLADWLQSSGAADRRDFREENTSPGYPPAEEEDPHETQEIERDDLTTALSDQLEEGDERREEEARRDESGERARDPSESGPRYMPDEPGSSRLAYAEGEGTEGVEETLDELEEAERKRRQEEAKRLVEQKHEPEEPEGAPEPAGRARSGPESSGAEGEGVPRIPGATKTRAGAEPSGEASAETEDEDAETTHSGDWQAAVTDDEEGAGRGRSSTPRAHPTPRDEEGAPEGEGEPGETGRSRKKTKSGVGETGLEQGQDSGVPVSFETVDTDEAAATESEPETEPEPEAAGEDRSVTDEAAEAVRKSAREALEEAALEAEDWSEEDRPPEEAGEEESRERESTAPYAAGGPVDSGEREAVSDEHEAAEPAEPEASDQEPAESGREGAETAEAAGAVPGEPASEESRDEEAAEPPEDIERVSNNGEVVRAEYDLSGPADEPDESPSADTLEGVARKPEPADETIESDETLEGVGGETGGAAGRGEETESAPSDDTLEGFSGVSGEVEIGEESEPSETEPPEPASEYGESESEPAESAEVEEAGETPGGDTQKGLQWDEEPTARDFDRVDDESDSEADEGEDRERRETGEETPPKKPEDEEARSGAEEPEPAAGTAEEESEGPEVRIESAAFASTEPGTGEEPEEEPEPEPSGIEEDTSPARPESETDESKTAAEARSPETEAPADETPSADEEPVETPETDEAEEDVDAIVGSADEADFFGEEADEDIDWDYDEEVESGGSGGMWGIVAGVLVIAGVAVWAVLFGPLAGSDTEEAADETDGPVAESQEPATEPEAGAKKKRQVPPPPSRNKKEAKSFAAALGASAETTAVRTARILGGHDPYLAKATPDAGDAGTTADAGRDAGPTKVAQKSSGKGTPGEKKTGESGSGATTGGASGGAPADEPTSSQGGGGDRGGGGGGVASETSEVRSLIDAGRLSEAESRLDDLKRRAPGSSSVASLYLQLASSAQINGDTATARNAYQSYLEMRPEGERADEVRSILDRL